MVETGVSVRLGVTVKIRSQCYNGRDWESYYLLESRFQYYNGRNKVFIVTVVEVMPEWER